MSHLFMVLAAALGGLALASCSKGSPLECGEGTVQRDNKCVVAPLQAAAAPTASPDPVPPPPPADLIVDAPAAPVSRWQYQSDTDKMRDVTSDFAANISTSSVDIGSPYGRVELRILLRKGPKFGNDIIVSLSKGQVSCSSYDGCNIAVRFDDAKVETYRAIGSDSPMNPVFFIRNVNGFVARLRTAKTAVIEVPTFTAGARQFEFDVAGLEWELYKGKVVRE